MTLNVNRTLTYLQLLGNFIPTQTLLFNSMTGSGLSDKSRLKFFGDLISDDKLKEKFRESIPKKTRENTK